MVKFESPEINVVLFSDSEVITTSSGYSDNDNSKDYSSWSYNSVTGGADGDFPL